MKKWLELLWGTDHPGLSIQERKRIKLTTQLSLLYSFSLFCFISLDFLVNYTVALPSHILGLVLSLLVVTFNKRGYFLTARILLTIAVNAEALFFAYLLDRSLNIFMFSICINIGTLAVYGYERIKLALSLMALSTMSFYVVMFYPHDRLPPPTTAYIDRNLMVVFAVSNIAATAIVYYFLRVNYKAEADLVRKENDLIEKHNQLVEVNAELDKFFYRVSHDLRAPLASMQGLITLMSRPEFEARDLATYLTMMKGRADNLEIFIKKIAEYSRNSRQQVVLESLSLRRIIRENFDNFAFYPNSEKIKTIIDISEETNLFSDSVRLQIIFGNLISNAIKYHDLTKPNPYIRVSSLIKGESICINIEDNGMGIDEESLPEIFNMFYRANDKTEGTGLGLYIVKDAVNKLEGKIEVISQYGHGTRFTITLPLVNSKGDLVNTQFKLPF